MRCLTISVAAIAACAASAQCPESHGMFAGLATALSHDDDPLVPLGPAAVYVKGQGFLAVPPTSPLSPIGRPDFDLEKVFRLCGVTRMPDVDALSIGEDWVLADDATGEVKVPPGRWAALTVSITRASKGARGTRLEREVANSDGAAADVFSYILAGSALPPELIGVTERAVDSREVDLGKGAQRNVDALDHLIPLYGFDPALAAATLPANPRLFFSITNASLAFVPQSWFGLQSKSGATILEIQWLGRTGWSCPKPFKTFRELGLDEREDLDGLAVDLLNERILFSTTTLSRDAILFLSCKKDDLPAMPYVEGGVSVAKKMGLLEDDDVDGICAMDPSLRSRGSLANPLYFAVGWPQPRLLPPTGSVSASAFRGYDGANPQSSTHVVGWPPVTGVGPGLAVCFISLEVQPTPWIFVGQFMRNPNPPFCGDPHEVSLTIPANLSLKGRWVDYHWFVADSALTNLGEAHPVRVRL